MQEMAADGVERAVAFSQYPQFSCTTAGSSLNHLWRESLRLGLASRFQWSVLDRWHTTPQYVEAVAEQVRAGLAKLDPAERARAIVVFSAHSLPVRIVNRGDQYPQEIAATAQAAINTLRAKDGAAAVPRYILAWQSKVGPLPWQGPSTGDVIDGLGRQGHHSVVIVPVGFTSDHVETLFEIDLEYLPHAAKVGIKHAVRAPSLNDAPGLIQAQAAAVTAHLREQQLCSPQYQLNCAGCVNPACRTILNPTGPYAKLRDSYPGQTCSVPRWPPGEPAPIPTEPYSASARQ